MTVSSSGESRANLTSSQSDLGTDAQPEPVSLSVELGGKTAIASSGCPAWDVDASDLTKEKNDADNH